MRSEGTVGRRPHATSNATLPDGQSGNVTISAADAKEYAQLDVNRAKKRHEKRRTNQVEVTTFELERMKTAATRNPVPQRKAAVAVQPKMMPCKRFPTRLGSQEKN